MANFRGGNAQVSVSHNDYGPRIAHRADRPWFTYGLREFAPRIRAACAKRTHVRPDVCLRTCTRDDIAYSRRDDVMHFRDATAVAAARPSCPENVRSQRDASVTSCYDCVSRCMIEQFLDSEAIRLYRLKYRESSFARNIGAIDRVTKM